MVETPILTMLSSSSSPLHWKLFPNRLPDFTTELRLWCMTKTFVKLNHYTLEVIRAQRYMLWRLFMQLTTQGGGRRMEQTVSELPYAVEKKIMKIVWGCSLVVNHLLRMWDPTFIHEHCKTKSKTKLPSRINRVAQHSLVSKYLLNNHEQGTVAAHWKYSEWRIWSWKRPRHLG